MLWKWGFRALYGLMILLLVGTAVVGGWLAWSDAKVDWREAVFGGCAWLFGFLAGDWRWPLRAGTGLRR